MTSVPSHARLTIALLTVFALGCARSGGSGASTAATTPQPAPSSGPTATAEDIERAGTRPIEEVLMTRFPGVWVQRAAGGGISVRIRGVSSFYGNNEPLYVLDGVPMSAGSGGVLMGLNPYDIATINVLKDPADTAIYGIRGGNGVIVITTKQ